MPQSRINKRLANTPPQMERPAVALLTDRQWQYLRRRFKITPRELEIAKLICLGLTNEKIAKRLKISTGTVKVHVRNLYRKTWVEIMDSIKNSAQSPLPFKILLLNFLMKSKNWLKKSV